MDDGMRARTEAIADFAAALRELRNSVGNPSFREMSGRSGAISHTTLHEATKGNRLPSWGTTGEFVKACGADPAGYHERWEKANLAVRSASAEGQATFAGTPAARPPGELAVPAADATEPQAMHLAIGSPAPQSAGETSASVPTPPQPPGEIAGDLQSAVPAPGGRRRFRLTLPAAATLATAAVGVVILSVAAANRGSEPDGHSPNTSGPPSKAAVSPSVCPVPPRQPAPAQPAHKGDAAKFVADITLPDCTRVGADKTITKVWRLKNTGTVPWKGYSLLRLDLPQRADQCQTRPYVPINDTRPGKTVDIRTNIITPRNPGLCYVRFKMVDASGRVAFPGSRPVNFQIIVNRPALVPRRAEHGGEPGSDALRGFRR